MSKIQGFILYRIWYGDVLVYLGRTKQPLQSRIHGHLFKKPMQRSISINLVTKIEYAEFQTEAAKLEMDRIMRRKWHSREITEEEYYKYLDCGEGENTANIDDI